MLKNKEVVAKRILLKKYSFSSLWKLDDILLRDLITSMPSNVENIIIGNDGNITRFTKSMYDIKSCEY